MTLLDVQGVRKRFHGLEVLRGVELSVGEDEIVGLIGPNGSGKTTLFNCITGLLSIDAGRITYRGRDITGRKPHQVTLAGLTRSFQIVQVYPRLTVLENLLLALQEHQERSALARVLRLPAVQRLPNVPPMTVPNKCLPSSTSPEFRNSPAGIMSYGQKKLVEFAAVLMPDPLLIMLDEPAAAVNPTMINLMKGHIRRLHGLGKSFLMVEHNMNVVMDLCHRVVVLDHGEKIAEGTPEQVRRDPLVLEAHFGR